MTKHIHLNFINEDEIVSSSPIRRRIVAPILVAGITLVTLCWWLLEFFTYSQLKHLEKKHKDIASQIQPRYQAVLKLNEQEKNLSAINAQLLSYRNSKHRFGKALEAIPSYVPTNIQFTKLEVPPPPPPLLEEEHPEKGPTNSFESVKLVITGRTTGSDTFKSVENLLDALKSNDFTNLVKSAHIPKGSFRQDIKKSNDGREYLVFGIECQCFPRKFE